MATKDQISKRVLEYFRAKWPSATKGTNLRDDLLLDDRQILDIGTELAEELNCRPTRTQILQCKTIGGLITLLIRTRSSAAPKGRLAAPRRGKPRSRKKAKSKRRASSTRKKTTR
jgi:hypothetical protein